MPLRLALPRKFFDREEADGYPEPFASMIADYQTIEKFLEDSYERHEDPAVAESLAAELLERIESQFGALEEEDEDDAPPVEIINAAFADAYTAAMADPYLREEVEDFLENGPKWRPAEQVVVRDRHWREMTREEPGHFEVPSLVSALRFLLKDEDADPVLLLEAAEEAATARDELREKLREGAPGRAVEEAQAFLNALTRRSR